MVDEPNSNMPGDAGGHSYYQNFQHRPIGARVPEKVGRGVFATTLMVLQTNELFVLDLLLMTSQPQQVVARIIMTAGGFSHFLDALRLNVKHYEDEIGPLKPRISPPTMGTWCPPSSPAKPAREEMPFGEERSAGQEGSAGQESAATGATQSTGYPGGVSDHGDMVPGGPAPQTGATQGTGYPVTEETPHDHSMSPPAGPITELYEQVRFPEDLLGGTFANAVMIRHTPEEFCFDFISSLYPRPVVVSRVFAAAGRVPSFIDAMAGSLGRYQSGGGRGPAE